MASIVSTFDAGQSRRGPTNGNVAGLIVAGPRRSEPRFALTTELIRRESDLPEGEPEARAVHQAIGYLT